MFTRDYFGSSSRRDFLRTSGRIVGGLTLAGILPAWTSGGPVDPTVVRSTWTMGTQIHLSLLGEAAQSHAERAAFAALARVNDALGVHDAASRVSELNRTPDVWIEADPDLLAMVRTARLWGERTEGAFDVTVLPVLRRLGFLPEAPGALAEQIDFRQLATEGSRVRISSGYGADFGGIAKGYGVDLGIDALRSAGLRSALLEAGGDLYALGRPADDRRWRVGVRDPRSPERLMAFLDVEDEAVATSGTYLQHRLWQGRSVSHLIDPRTGSPVRHVVSATITAPDACTADLLATATSVLPPAQSLDLLAGLPGVEGLWIAEDRTATMTPGMRRRLSFA